MSVRTRITVAFLAVFLVCAAVNYAVEHLTVLREFQRIEAEGAERNVNRWAQALQREVSHLTAFAGDWTIWDDAWDFVQTGSQEFIESNLSSEDWFRDFDLPILRFYRSDGALVWSRQIDPGTGEPMHLPALDAALAPGGVLATRDGRDEASGLLQTEAGLMLVASRAVVHTDGSGPAAGFAAFARFAGEELVQTIVRQAVCEGDITTMEALRTAGSLDEDGLAALAGGRVVMEKRSGVISAYRALNDLDGRPAVVVRSDTPASVSAQGRLAMWQSVVSLSLAGLIALAVQLYLVAGLVLRPLERLIEHARNVKSTGDLAARFSHPSRDEFGELAAEFDGMVERLAASHTELVARSRVVGKAEIATSVTHNLGNVLNSAVVSLDVVAQQVAKLRADGCTKAADLLETSATGPAAPGADRIAQVPRYLRSLGEALERDRAGLRDEVDRLRAQLRHMGEILDAQRTLAAQGQYEELVDPAEAIERAIALMALSLERHRITLERDLHDAPSVQSDPVQLLQILVNLLTNAKEAITKADAGERRIRFGLRAAGDRLRITVTDTGCGIEPESLERIFQNGYTTKPSSSGIGLHFCSIAARQLGGTLTAASEGHGRGATFTLELPVEAAERRAAA